MSSLDKGQTILEGLVLQNKDYMLDVLLVLFLVIDAYTKLLLVPFAV